MTDVTASRLGAANGAAAKSADLNVARQFSKDNGIEALAVEGSPLSSLVATMPNFSDAVFDKSKLKTHQSIV